MNPSGKYRTDSAAQKPGFMLKKQGQGIVDRNRSFNLPTLNSNETFQQNYKSFNGQNMPMLVGAN